VAEIGDPAAIDYALSGGPRRVLAALPTRADLSLGAGVDQMICDPLLAEPPADRPLVDPT